MKKLLLISAAVLLMFAVLAPASAAPNGPPNGFILQDTDAAYAAFDDGDGCDVFVGYVRTDRLKWLGQPGGFQPHSDLEVTLTHSDPDSLTGSCVHVPIDRTLGGVVDTLNPVPPEVAEFVTLDEATINEIDVDLYLTDEANGVMTLWGVATVDLYWEAEGEVVKWKVNNPGDHSRHESMSAPVEGSVTITETGENSWSVDDGAVIDGVDWFTETGLLPGPIITFYDEVTVRQ